MPLCRCFVCGGYVGCDCQDLSKIPDLFFRKMSDLIPAPVAKGDMPQVGLLKKKKKKDKRLKSKPKEPGDDGGSDLESEQQTKFIVMPCTPPYILEAFDLFGSDDSSFIASKELQVARRDLASVRFSL